MTWNLVHQQSTGKIVWCPKCARTQISKEQISTSFLPSEPVQQCLGLKLCSCDEAGEKNHRFINVFDTLHTNFYIFSALHTPFEVCVSTK